MITLLVALDCTAGTLAVSSGGAQAWPTGLARSELDRRTVRLRGADLSLVSDITRVDEVQFA
jgi:hypothetical protein